MGKVTNESMAFKEELMVSVIVPIYNAEKYLEKCVESIIDQTYRYLDIILVNDGSNDKSLNICEQYKRRDSRITVVSRENQGLVCARKEGLLQAKGSLIAFVDSDDWIEPDTFEKLIKIYKENESDLISMGIFLDYEDSGKSIEIHDNYEEGFYNNLDMDIYPTMLRNPEVKSFGLFCSLCNKLFVKDKLMKVYEDINTEISYGEDCAALYRYCLSVDSVYICKESGYHYNIRKGSMCRSKDEQLLYNTYLLYQELKKDFMKYSNPSILMKQLKRYILDVEMHSLRVLFDIDLNVLGKWKFRYEAYYNSRIIIYGAGLCGQALYHQICSCRKEQNIAAWVDKNYLNQREKCLYRIESPEIIPMLEYDYIIIALVDKDLANQIKNELSAQFMIKEDSILWEEVRHENLLDEIF